MEARDHTLLFLPLLFKQSGGVLAPGTYMIAELKSGGSEKMLLAAFIVRPPQGNALSLILSKKK